MNDYYSLLGVQRTATSAEIKKNFRLLATKFHPDKNPDPDASDKFIAISEAYEVLRHKKRRAQYDLFRYQELKQKREAAESFTVVAPPRESTRTRRNRAQKKRSIAYHQTDRAVKKNLLLVTEGFRIFARYILHLLGLTLFSVILTSVIIDLKPTFEIGLLAGLLNSAFAAGMGYILYLIAKNFLTEIIKDAETFSVLYRTPKRKASVLVGLVFLVVFIAYLLLLSLYS